MMYKYIFLTLMGWLCIALHVKAQSITISEVNYKSDITKDCGDWLELYNYGTTSIDLSGWTMVDSGAGSVPYTIPSGTQLAPQAFIVITRNSSKFLAVYPSVTNKIGSFGYKLNPTDRIILKDAANNTVLQMDYNDNVLWPDGPDGEGRTLELININSNANLSNPASWKNGCMGGSPGVAYSNCDDPIIFTEINYNSDSLLDVSEFIELYNTTSSPINLSGYELRDEWDSLNNIYTFPQGTILPSHDYLVVTNNKDSLLKWHSGITKYLGDFTFNLSNGGEVIRLFNANKLLTFSCHYRDTLGWPLRADGDSMTLELKDNHLGQVNDPTNWQIGCPGGSPTYKFSLPCPPLVAVGLQQIAKQYGIVVAPNPTHNFITASFNEAVFDTYIFLDMTGKIIETGAIKGNKTTVSLVNKPQGMYMLLLKGKNGLMYQQKVIKQ